MGGDHAIAVGGGGGSALHRELSTDRQSQSRSNGIDCLRCVFAIYVLVFSHLAFWIVPAQGNTAAPVWFIALARAFAWLFQRRGELNPAVIGFIVLSGYCIHRNGLRSAHQVQGFAIRRAFRILPVFFAAGIIGVAVFIKSSEISPSVTRALSSTSSISPVCFFTRTIALPAVIPVTHGCDYLGNAPLLTVMVEITLYAFYGFVFPFGWQSIVLPACGLGVIVGIAIATQGNQTALFNWWQNSSFLSFLPIWWIGAAAIVPRWRKLIQHNATVIIGGWLFLTVIENFVDPTPISAEIRKYFLALIAALLVIKADGTRMPNNPASWIGRAGYSLYAFHAPILIYLLVSGITWWVTAIVAVAFAILFYYTFERPLDRVGHRLAN